MLKIIAELVPGGVPGLKRTIGTMDIANVSDLAPRSDYEAIVRESANRLTGDGPRSCTVIYAITTGINPSGSSSGR